MENSKELLLVHRAMKPVSLSEPVNVMLTPQFYTLKKESVPVKYAYQAKKLANSLFEGSLDKEGSYDFFVYKENDHWIYIAYDIETITAFLETKGFRAGDVSKLFFVQQAREEFRTPYFLSDQDTLIVLDETVVVVPASALGSQKALSFNFDRHLTPKRGVPIEGVSASLFTTRQAAIVSLVFMLFAAMFYIEGARYGGENISTSEELQSFYADYPSLQSTYTRESIVSKYRELDQTERAKRDAVKKLSGMLFKGVTLTSLSIDHQSVKANFSCDSKKTAQRVTKLGKKAQFKVFQKDGAHDLHMEGSL